MFGWRLATKEAIAVCQRRMPFSRTSSFLVKKYERAVCARAISCWHCCCTARRSLRHAHFIVERVPFVSPSVFLILSVPQFPPPLSSCLPSFLCLFICMYTHPPTLIDTQTNATETAISLQLHAYVFTSAPREERSACCLDVLEKNYPIPCPLVSGLRYSALQVNLNVSKQSLNIEQK